MSELRGSCACGAVSYLINGPLGDPLYCHCTICRKLHGSAFRARALVCTSDFYLTAGEEQISFFQSSPGTHRGFCRNCGSPLFSKFDSQPQVLGLPLGSIDGDPGVRPRRHAFVGSKAVWFAICDNLHQSDGS